MPDFITLSCPSCGGKLQITKDIQRFACAYCGQEHIVKWGSGIVSLSPIVDGLKQVEKGVDKTSAELAIIRLPKEIGYLTTEIDRIKKANPYPIQGSIGVAIFTIVIGIFFVIVSIYYLANRPIDPYDSSKEIFTLLCVSPGIAVVILGVVFLSKNKSKEELESDKVKWEATTGKQIKSLNDQIVQKMSELAKVKKILSQ
jgi:hypothetical protein